MPNHRFRSFGRPVVIAALLALAGSPVALAAPRVGDAGSVPDPARFDEAYPDMKGWSEAGVAGGIPLRADGKVLATLKPGDNVQAAINDAAKAGGGVVLLSAGTYRVVRPIELRPGVILRGAAKESAVLECEITAARPSDDAVTVRFGDVAKAGLEDLTVRHQAVAKVGLAIYQERFAGAANDPKGAPADLYVGGVQFQRAEDCWIDNCDILHSGTRPLVAQGNRLTIRDVLIDGALNKGDGTDPAGSGNVSLPCDHGLLYNCTVKNVRHALVVHGALSGAPCKYNVILDCNFEGDVNFHGNRKDEGHNLFEGTFVHSPPWHGWQAWSYWRKTDIGPENLVYRSIGWGGPGKDYFISTNPEKVYTYTGVRDTNNLPAIEKAPPRVETLYAVTGERKAKPESFGAWPKTPAEATRVLEQRMIKSPLATLAR